MDDFGAGIMSAALLVALAVIGFVFGQAFERDTWESACKTVQVRHLGEKVYDCKPR